jgi:hypothetical protein
VGLSIKKIGKIRTGNTKRCEKKKNNRIKERKDAANVDLFGQNQNRLIRNRLRLIGGWVGAAMAI